MKNKIWETVYQNVIVNILLLLVKHQLPQDILKSVGKMQYHANFFATSIQEYYACPKFSQNFINVFDRFLPQ